MSSNRHQLRANPRTAPSLHEHEHVHHLMAAYTHGQLRPSQRRRILLHVQSCGECRAALDADMRLAADLHTFLPKLGQPTAGKIRSLYPKIRAQTARRKRSAWWWQITVLPAYGMAVTVLLIACVLLGSALFVGPSRAIASPMSPADVKATWTPIFTGEPTRVAANSGAPAIEASATAGAQTTTVERALPVSPVPVASIEP